MGLALIPLPITDSEKSSSAIFTMKISIQEVETFTSLLKHIIRLLIEQDKINFPALLTYCMNKHILRFVRRSFL